MESQVHLLASQRYGLPDPPALITLHVTIAPFGDLMAAGRGRRGDAFGTSVQPHADPESRISTGIQNFERFDLLYSPVHRVSCRYEVFAHGSF
jgi:hypothetical protein